MAASPSENIQVVSIQPLQPADVRDDVIDRYIQLDPISLVAFSALQGVLVIDDEIDIERLQLAVAQLAGWYPTIAGRYVSRTRTSAEQSDFAIELKGAAIPLELAVYERAPSETTTYPFPSRAVVQSSLAPYAPSLQAGFDQCDSHVPLFVLRHTLLLPERRSVLGIAISHTLADAASCSKLQQDLAYLYRHPGSALPYPPHFHARVDHRPLHGLGQSQLDDIFRTFKTNLLVPHDTSTLLDNYLTAMQSTEEVCFRLDQADVKAMVAAERKGYVGLLSEQDILSGWWIDLIERLGEEVRTLSYAINYRELHKHHTSFPRDLETQFSTVAQIRDFNIEAKAQSGKRSADIAKIIRAEIDELKRSPDHAHNWLAHAAFWHEQAAKENKGFDYIPAEGAAVINSNVRYDWTPCFQQGGLVAYHTTFSARRFLRLFQQNRTSGDETSGAIEMVFRVKNGLAVRAHALFEADRAGWRRGAAVKTTGLS